MYDKVSFAPSIVGYLHTVSLLKNGCENYHVLIFEKRGYGVILIQRDYDSGLLNNIYQYLLLLGGLLGKLTGFFTEMILNGLPFYLSRRGEVSVVDSPV